MFREPPPSSDPVRMDIAWTFDYVNPRADGEPASDDTLPERPRGRKRTIRIPEMSRQAASADDNLENNILDQGDAR